MRPVITTRDSDIAVVWPTQTPKAKSAPAIIANDANELLKANRPKRAKVIHPARPTKPHPFEAWKFSPDAANSGFTYDAAELPSSPPINTLLQRGKITRDQHAAALRFAADLVVRAGGADHHADAWIRMNFIEVNFSEADGELLRDICVRELPSQLIARKWKSSIPATRENIRDVLRRLEEMYRTIEGLYDAPRSYDHNSTLK